MTTTHMTTETIDQIGYEHLSREALRAVPRKALAAVAEKGCLPGDHHFVLTFSTTHSDVDISRELKKRFTSEMTIIIQHQFAELNVSDDAFEVVLKFDGRPETVHVPFVAMVHFSDPSVPYAIDFGTPEGAQAPDAATEAETQSARADVVVSLDAFRNNS